VCEVLIASKMTVLNARTLEPLPSLSANETRWLGHMADDIASTYGPEPLAFLMASPDALVLSGTRGTFRLPRAAVTKLGRGKMYPWFFSALRIHHAVSSYPSALQFKPLGAHWREVQAKLKSLGYPVG
jgi:hypothetical protein